MGGRTDFLESARDALFENIPARRTLAPPASSDSDEVVCAAFGYLRGLHERALNIEFRFRNGNREFYPYCLIAGCRYDPSVGLLLKITGDVTTLVLIRGSNLDVTVNQGTIDLIEGGLQRHRVVWIREMDQAELRKCSEREPTIDRIEIAEFESQEELRDWLGMIAPRFCRNPK